MENRQGKGKNSIGNVEAKELICMTHGHELKGRNMGGRGWAGKQGTKGGKWDNCNSIINKIYIFFKRMLTWQLANSYHFAFSLPGTQYP